MPNLYGQTSFYSLLSQITLIWQIPSYSFSLTNPNKRGKGLIIYAHPLHITSSLPYNAFLPCKGRVTAFNTKDQLLYFKQNFTAAFHRLHTIWVFRKILSEIPWLLNSITVTRFQGK